MGEGYLPWMGEEVPTLDRGGTYLGMGEGYLPWDGGGVPTLNGGGVPTLDRGTYLGWVGVTYLGCGNLPLTQRTF